MTERTDDIESADDALRLRVFAGPSSEAPDSPGSCEEAVRRDGIASEREGLPAGELPPDLLALAERLTKESHSLAMTYPARSPERLPLGEVVLASASPAQEPSSGTEAFVEVSPPVAVRWRRIVGAGMVATVGLAAIVTAAIYSAATGGPRDSSSTIAMPLDDGASVGLGRPETPPISQLADAQVRTVSLSLADDGDYRRLESLLRNRSEPEREAMFDLLQDGDGGETAVRISF